MGVRFYASRPGPIPDSLAKIIGVSGESRVNILGWVIEGGVLKPEELPEAEKRLDEVVAGLETDKPLIITGRGPLWLYSMIVHNVHYFREVAVWDPRNKRAVVIEGVSSHLGKGLGVDGSIVDIEMEAQGVLEKRLVKAKDYQVFQVEVKKDRYLHPKILGELDREITELAKKDIDHRKPIVLYGPMPVWLASFLTAKLVHKAPALGVYDPRLGSAVITATHHPGYRLGELLGVDASILEKKDTIIVGVVGHPNSGKSVFLHLLGDALKKKGVRTLIQEADITAPTQHWSLFAPNVRKELKKYMNPEERLKWIIDSLEGLKRSGTVDVVLADIGGGRPDLGQLVTRENAAILQRVDAVVIVTREGEDEWLRQIDTYTPGVRIVAVLRSRLTGRAYFNRSLRSGVVVGLDRKLYAEGAIPEDTRKVVEEVASLIERRDFIDVRNAVAARRMRGLNPTGNALQQSV